MDKVINKKYFFLRGGKKPHKEYSVYFHLRSLVYRFEFLFSASMEGME